MHGEVPGFPPAVPTQELDLHMPACSRVNIMGWCSPQRASCSLVI